MSGRCPCLGAPYVWSGPQECHLRLGLFVSRKCKSQWVQDGVNAALSCILMNMHCTTDEGSTFGIKMRRTCVWDVVINHRFEGL